MTFLQFFKLGRDTELLEDRCTFHRYYGTAEESFLNEALTICDGLRQKMQDGETNFDIVQKDWDNAMKFFSKALKTHKKVRKETTTKLRNDVIKRALKTITGRKLKKEYKKNDHN